MLFRRKVHKSPGEGFPIEVCEKDGVRTLHFGNGTVQSAMRLARPHDLELAYTRAMMGFVLFTGSPGEEVLMVGLGGGSLAKFCLNRFARTRVVAVEKEPRVVTVARNFFELPAAGERLRIEIGDGADYVAAHPGAWNAVLVDGYDDDCQVPHLATEDFYRSCRTALKPGGVAVINLWGSDPLYADYVERTRRAFDGRMLCLPAEKRGNVIIFGFDQAPRHPGWNEWRERARRLDMTYGIEFTRFADALIASNSHDSAGWSFAA